MAVHQVCEGGAEALTASSNIAMTTAGAVYSVPGSDLKLLPAVMTDGGGQVIGSSDLGDGTSAVLAMQVGPQVGTLYHEQPTARTASGNAGGLTSNPATAAMQGLFLGVNVTAVSGTSPSLTVSIQQQDANGVWQTIASTPALSAVGTAGVSAGVGTSNPAMLNGGPYQLAWTISSGGSFTFQMSLQGR